MNHSSLGRVVCSLKCYPPLKNVTCFFQLWNFVSVVTSLWQVKDTRIGSPTVTFTPGMTWQFSYLSFCFFFPCFTFILSWNFVVNQVNGVYRSCLKKKAMLNDHTTLVDDIEMIGAGRASSLKHRKFVECLVWEQVAQWSVRCTPDWGVWVRNLAGQCKHFTLTVPLSTRE